MLRNFLCRLVFVDLTFFMGNLFFGSAISFLIAMLSTCSAPDTLLLSEVLLANVGFILIFIATFAIEFCVACPFGILSEMMIRII